MSTTNQQMTESQPAVPAEKKTSESWLREPVVYERIESALSGWGVPVDQFISEMVIAFADPNLKPCTEGSKFAAAHTCATLGLSPALKQVALIPRKAGNALVIDVMPQWQGYKSQMERHPEVLEVNAYLVHQSDRYDYDPLQRALVNHQFDPFDPARKIEKLSDIKGGYLEIVYRNPQRPRKFHFVTLADIEKARSCAPTKNVWDKWPRQQALKTLYRDGYARRVVPIDPLIASRIEAALAFEDKLHQNDPLLGAVGSPPAKMQHQSRAERIAHQYSTDSQPQMPEREVETIDATATTAEPKKKGRKKEASQPPADGSDDAGATEGAAPGEGPPEMPKVLVDYANAVHQQTTVEGVSKLEKKWVLDNESLSDDELEAGKAMAAWKRQQLS